MLNMMGAHSNHCALKLLQAVLRIPAAFVWSLCVGVMFVVAKCISDVQLDAFLTFSDENRNVITVNVVLPVCL